MVPAEGSDNMDKVFSPSSTATWMRCPMLRVLSNEGWMPKYVGKAQWAALLGQGFAAGVGIYNTIRQEHERGGTPLPPRDATSRADLVKGCQESAVKMVDDRRKEMEDVGIILDDTDGYRERLDNRVRKAVKDYIISDPIPDDWQIVDAEKDFGPKYGNARPDVVVRDTTGLAIVDYKSKLVLRSEYRIKTITEYANSHQQYHYAWAAREVYGEDVAKYYIGLAVLEPRWAFDLIPYPVSSESLALWHSTASSAWRTMDAQDSGNELPWMSAVHADNFGQCPMYKACFVHRFDPGLMVADYVHVNREKV